MEPLFESRGEIDIYMDLCERIGVLYGDDGYLAVVNSELKLDDTDRSPVRRAALLHDVGKIAIPDSILEKPSGLDADELAFVRRHTLVGGRILRAAPALEAVAPLVRSSHERWDGGGYPDGLRADSIPRSAALLAIVDSYDAMTSNRPYRKGLPHERAVGILQGGAGDQWDPELIAKFDFV